jgi:hypothetical protein
MEEVPLDKRALTTRGVKLRKLIAGIRKRIGPAPVMLAGTSYTRDELAQRFQDELDAMKVVEEASAARMVAVAKRNNVTARNKPVRRALEAHVRAMHGQNASVLGDFALEPLKEQKKKVDTKLEAQKKAKATREARGTMGPKAKKKIKGQLPPEPKKE